MTSQAAEVDPRVERSRRVVLAAALEVLGEEGYGGLTIEAVAARAGVGKSTIYRHWDGKLALVDDAIRTLRVLDPPPTEGSVRDRVVAVLQQVTARMADSTWSVCLPALVDAAERDPQVREVHRALFNDRRSGLVRLLTAGVAAGEISADADLGLLAESLIGPLVVRRLLTHEPLDPALVPRLVDQVLGRAQPPA